MNDFGYQERAFQQSITQIYNNYGKKDIGGILEKSVIDAIIFLPDEVRKHAHEGITDEGYKCASDVTGYGNQDDIENNGKNCA